MVDLTSIIAAIAAVISLTTIILRKQLIEAFFFGMIASSFVAFLIFYNEAADLKKPFWIIIGFTFIYYTYLIFHSIRKKRLKNNRIPVFTPKGPVNEYPYIIGNTGTGGISENYRMITFILDLARNGGRVHYINLNSRGEHMLRILEFVDPFDNLNVHRSIEETNDFIKKFTYEIKSRKDQYNEGSSLEELPIIYLIYDDDDQHLSETICRLLDNNKDMIRNLRIVFVLSENVIEHIDFFTERSVLRSHDVNGGLR
ncbi:MAG: hypothetical protein ACE3L7_32710 [Candidatus Pristimantibacillus sp.]